MKNTLLLFAFSICSFLSAQQVSETIFGDSGWNNPQKIWQMPDGNIAVVSGSNAGSFGSVKLYHINLSGQVVATYDLPLQSASNFIQPSADGATFQFGRMETGSDYMIRHLNLQGQTLDSIKYHTTDPLWDDYSFAIQPAPNGDLVLAYEDQEPPQGVWIARVNPQGSMVFSKYVSSSDPDFYGNCLTVLPNGRTIVVVLDYSQGYRVNCYSPTGSLLWTKGVPQIPSFAEDFGMVPLGIERAAFFGHDGSVGNVVVDGYAAVYKSDGTFAYNRTFENDIPGFAPYVGFADGDDLILAGNYHDPDEYGLAVIKINASGQTVFVRKFDLLSGDGNIKAALTFNGDYVISGFQWEHVSQGTLQSNNGYAICLQSDGTLNWFASGPAAEVRLMNGFCHLTNGDMVFAGQAFQPQLPAGEIRNLLLQVSDIGPVYTHLIQGKITLDTLENCISDQTEPTKHGWLIKAETADGARYAVSDDMGNYNIRLKQNAAVVSTEPPNGLWAPCSASYPIDFTNADTAVQKIPVKALASCPYLSLDVSTNILRRCFNNTYHCSWCNNGSTMTENLALTIELDSFTNFVSSSIPLIAQNGRMFSFLPGDIAPGDCGEMSLTVNISCEAPLHQIHCLNAGIEASNACNNFPGGTYQAHDCQANVGSFDPNDKRAFVGDTIREGYILPNTDIRYQIRFQNTGTDTAFNIVVVDTIANTLDISTLRLGTSSHPCSFQLQGGNLAKFIFNNIQLPDSIVNETASHGFVNFIIAQKPDLPVLTSIENRADIYFDFNDAVGTNLHRLTVNKTISTTTPANIAADIIVYPNPATTGEVWVENNNPTISILRVLVFDATGQLKQALQPQGSKLKLLLPEQKGIYFLNILQDNGALITFKIVR